MPLRRYMHPRNRYRVPPNFKELAKLYPEFHEHVVTDLRGKLRFNFNNEQSLRILTKTLLKHDFNLQVEIPLHKLVPALPLRLNYILWVEDLLNHGKIDNIHGLDIGTGAICIYPLLCAKILDWKMTATEIDISSVKSAKENIAQNNLGDLINVMAVNADSIFKEIVTEDSKFSFSMCNPPFFNADKSTPTVKKTPPRNAKTGTDCELSIGGGELSFIMRMIEESVKLGEKVKIYTTMLGQKSSFTFFRSELSRRGINNAIWTEFCQGYTKRWGLAWSFVPQEQLNLTTAPVIRTRDSVTSKKPDNWSTELLFPLRNSIEDLLADLKQWIEDLKIQIDNLDLQGEDFDGYSFHLTTNEDTWSHARRKRRLQARLEQEKSNKLSRIDGAMPCPVPVDDSASTSVSPQLKQLYLDFCLVLGTVENYEDNDKNDRVKICLILNGGLGGKNALESFKQFLINKLDIREYLQAISKKKSLKTANKARKKSKLTNQIVEN